MNANFLTEIVALRRKCIAPLHTNSAALRRAALLKRESRPAHALREAVKNPGINIIAEFKRASPSAGLLRPDADIAAIVVSYENGGACAVSILTEPDFFKGSLADLERARAATNLPLLRKDFIVDELQVFETAAAGADAILLIVAALDDDELTNFCRVAEDELAIDALVEVHSAEELHRAVDADAKLIGVNNRDLRTLTTSLETSFELAALAPKEVVLVSESGISSAKQIRELRRAGFAAFLIGESLMRTPDPTNMLRSLREAEDLHHA